MTSPTDKSLRGNTLILGSGPTTLSEEELVSLLSLLNNEARLIHIGEYFDGVILDAYAIGREHSFSLPNSPTGYWTLQEFSIQANSSLSDGITRFVVRNTKPGEAIDKSTSVELDIGEEHAEVISTMNVPDSATLYVYPTLAGQHDDVTVHMVFFPGEAP